MVFKYNGFGVFPEVMLCLMFAVLVISQGPIKTCKINEVVVNYTFFSPLCAPHCPGFERIGIACVRRNGTQCICKPDWVYSHNRTCIPKKYCPAIGDPNTEFSNCNAACQVTCDCFKPQTTQISSCRCDRTCVPGYVCLKGYTRNATAGHCIPVGDCPKSF